jgi:hypothetical protein
MRIALVFSSCFFFAIISSIRNLLPLLQVTTLQAGRPAGRGIAYHEGNHITCGFLRKVFH